MANGRYIPTVHVMVDLLWQLSIGKIYNRPMNPYHGRVTPFCRPVAVSAASVAPLWAHHRRLAPPSPAHSVASPFPGGQPIWSHGSAANRANSAIRTSPKQTWNLKIHPGKGRKKLLTNHQFLDSIFVFGCVVKTVSHPFPLHCSL